MNLSAWPTADHQWVLRYRTAIEGRHVPADALQQRETELLTAVREARVPAGELFGDAAALAEEDAAELATTDEAVRTAEGGGLKPVITDLGGMLVAFASVGIILMVVRTGWFVDVDLAGVLAATSVIAGVAGWNIGKAQFAAGNPIAMTRVIVAAVAVVVGCIGSAVALGPNRLVADDAPVLLLGIGLLTPGLLALAVAHRMPAQALQEEWDDAEWLRRFRGGLRARFMPAATIRGHVTEIEQTLAAGTQSAVAEFGHPLVLARELTEADRTARARQWWVGTLAGTTTPLVMAGIIIGLGTGGTLAIPMAAFLVLSAVMALAIGWDARPWAERR